MARQARSSASSSWWFGCTPRGYAPRPATARSAREPTPPLVHERGYWRDGRGSRLPATGSARGTAAEVSVFYWFLKWIALGPWLRLVFRPRVYGAENVPIEGPAILASNHLSY